MGTRHVLRGRAALAAHIAALVNRDPLAAMEDLDRSRGDARFDLGANERMGNRVEKVVDFDVIVEVDSGAPPLRELPILGRQRGQRVAFDLFEQLPPARAQMAHRVLVHALHDQRDGLVAFGEREEGLRPQSPKNVGLREPDTGLDRLLRPVWGRPASARGSSIRFIRRLGASSRSSSGVDIGAEIT